jgi:hypothetical protein
MSPVRKVCRGPGWKLMRARATGESTVRDPNDARSQFLASSSSSAFASFRSAASKPSVNQL